MGSEEHRHLLSFGTLIEPMKLNPLRDDLRVRVPATKGTVTGSFELHIKEGQETEIREIKSSYEISISIDLSSKETSQPGRIGRLFLKVSEKDKGTLARALNLAGRAKKP